MSTLFRFIRVPSASVVVTLLMMQSLYAASSGSIVGRVFDKATGDPLPGANVLIQGTSIGSSTDLDGKYALRSVPTGRQPIRVTYVGYVTATVDADVAADSIMTLDFRLTAQAIEGETILVTGQAKGQMAAINQQLSSNSIINVVSADKMKELPDANIAESIGRLPGISLQRYAGEAYAVVVRGLSPKYNEVTIEGIPMSSTNYFDRSIDLSLLSDDLVRSVEVSKTLRPDMDADALGGTVNLTLKSADPGLHYTASGNGAYNNLRETYKNYRFSASVSDRFLDDQLGVLVQGNMEQKQLPSDQFSGSYENPRIQSTTGVFYINTSSATLTEANVNRHRYGASVTLDYVSDFVDIKFFNVYEQKRDSNTTRTNASNFLSNSYAYNIYANETKTEQRTHSLVALFKPWGTELPVSLSYTKGNQSVPKGMEFDFVQTGLPALSPSLVVYGEPAQLIHAQGVMNPANSTLWDLFVSDTKLRDESYDAKIDWRIPFTLSETYSGKLSVGGKFHEVSRSSGNTRIWYNVQWGGSKGRRELLINAFPFLYGVNADLEAGIPAAPFVDPTYKRSDILGYPIGPGYDVNRLTYMMNSIYPAWLTIFYQDGVGSFNQDYSDNERTWAGYVMGEFNVGTDLTVVPGVRYQDEITDISAYHIKLNGSNQNGLAGEAPRLVESKRNTPNWYPSVNIKYKVTQDVQILGAAYRSVSLPSYGDINPLVEYSLSPTAVATANPFVKPSTAWNFDLGATFANNDIGLVTVNLFYKEISDLVYTMQNYMPFLPYPVVGAPADIWDRLPGLNSDYFDTTWATATSGKTAYTSIPMNDPHKAFLRGVEISWQTHLWYLPGVLSGVVLDLNASFMSSRQLYPSFEVVNEGSLFRPIYKLYYRTVAGALQDQPKATYNAILGWDYLGFSSRFSLRYQKLTLTSMDTQFGLRNSFYDDVLLFDIALKQQIIENLSVFANATNVNGHVDNYYYSHPSYGTHAAGQLPTNEQTYGWLVQAGVSFNY